MSRAREAVAEGKMADSDELKGKSGVKKKRGKEVCARKGGEKCVGGDASLWRGEECEDVGG